MEFDYALPDRWKWVPLGELADTKGRAIVSGPFGSNISSRFFVDAGIPVIRGNNLTTCSQKFVDDGFVFVTPEKAKELGNVDAVRDDIIFTAAGSLGQVGIIPERTRFPVYIISNKQMRVRLNSELIDPLFAFQWLSSSAMVEFIQRQNTGSSVPLINLGIIRRIPVPLPPLPEQRAIASILGSLDDKIELNRRMNETLEGIARALFKSWFVDFDPVRAKMDGRQPAGMSPEIANLFPSEFEQSEGALIPRGWRSTPLSMITDVVMGTSPKSDTYNESGIGIPLVNGPVEFGSYFPLKRKWTTAPTRFSQAQDLIFCVRGSTTGRRVVSDGQYCLGRGVCSIRAKDGWHAFIYKTVDFEIDRLLLRTTGSVFPNLSAPEIKGFEVLHPGDELVSCYCAHVAPMQEHVEQSVRESESLATLRDTLLPKLLSGELRVPEADKMLEEVL